MSEYIAGPRGTSSPFEPTVVALTAATTKTVLQVATPSTTDIRILGWGVSFDASAAAQPGWAQLISHSSNTPATVTSLTPDLWGNAQSPASLCVGGTTATGYNSTSENTITGTPVLHDHQHVYPQSGYAVWFPQTAAGNSPRIGISSFLRIRCKFPAGVNVLPWIVWAEPAV